MSLEKKVKILKKRIVEKHGCKDICQKCSKIHALVDEMNRSNIPCSFWNKKIKDFKGPENLKAVSKEYVEKIDNNYEEGNSICIAGNYGIGKTYCMSYILKEAIKNNYSIYYITARDIFENSINSGSIIPTIKNVDFLGIDELDSRFFTSDSLRETFSYMYEGIFRHRCHNNLPTIICTNETKDISNIFYGVAIQSINSLNSQYLKKYCFSGKDYRKKL